MNNDPQIPDALKKLVEAQKSGKIVSPSQVISALGGKPPATASKPVPKGRPGVSKARTLPTMFKHIVKVEWYRRFTLRERIAILFGANFVAMIGVATQHSPGSLQPLIVGNVSKHTTPDSHMRECIENMLEKRDSPLHNMIEPEPPKPIGKR